MQAGLHLCCSHITKTVFSWFSHDVAHKVSSLIGEQAAYERMKKQAEKEYMQEGVSILFKCS